MNSDDSTHQPLCPSYRLLVCLIAFLGDCCCYGSQALISASFLLMKSPDDDVSVNISKSGKVYAGEFSNKSTTAPDDEWHYDWATSTKGWLLSSYFVGYYVMQLPVGCLTGRWGGHKLIVRSGAVTVLCQALFVWIPHYGPYPFAVVLFLTGMANSCSFPALISVTAKWCPPRESSRLMSIVLSGMCVGNALVYCVSAGAARIETLGGWPFIVITIVIMQLAFLCLWWILVTDSPNTNTFAKSSEVIYIQKQFPILGVDNSSKTDIPWRKILTSPLVYAVASSLFGADWLVYGIITVFPAYFTDVRNMSNSMVSVLSGLPWLVCPFTAYLVSQGVDMLRERRCLSTSTLRKIADVIAKPVAGGFLLASSLLPEGQVASAAMLYALSIITIMSFQGCSWAANIAELSADHAGAVVTIAQLVSMTGPFVAPPLFEALTPNKSAGEWQVCFAITLAICVVTTLIYIILGSSQPQHWETNKKDDPQ